MNKRTIFALGAWAALAIGGIAHAEERNTLENVNVSAAGDQVVVRLSFANPLTSQPPGFSLTKPARVALDFTETDAAIQTGAQSVTQAFLRSYNVAQAGNRMRVVFNLDRPAAYQTQIDGKDLIVLMNAAPAIELASPTPSAEPFAIAQPAIQALTQIRDIAFRRGKDGEARVLVDLQTANTAGIDIRKQGGSLIVEFSKTDLPASLARKLDVTDFSTPVSSIDTFRRGDRVRMVVAGKGNWDHLAYQADNQFVVELRPVSQETAQLGSAGRYTGERLSLRFRDYPVKEVLQAFSDFASFNIVISEAVGGTISLNLQDVPWDQALEIIMQQKGLDKRVDGNVVMIAPREEIIARNKVKTEAIELEMPQDAVFQVNYLTADVAKKKLEEYLKFDPKASKGNKLMSESGSNKLFIKAPESTLEDIRRVLKEIDLPPRQVLIEARIVEASDSFSRDLGTRLGINDNHASRLAGQNNLVLQQLGASVALPVAGGNLNFLLTNATQTRTLSLELTALEADGNGKIISSPRVLAMNGESAKIEDGQEIPYLQASSSGATSVSFKKATLSLDVTPTINADGRIGMEIKVNKDSPGAVVPGGVAINTKQVTTKVVVDNGGTVVIGGIYSESERFDESGIPGLRDIPGLGWLFKTRTTSKQRSELLVFITPRIVNEQVTLQ
ncbi:MAG TPA: type IV pilus secretin PilQ [Rhodocyclaceae bacterium]